MYKITERVLDVINAFQNTIVPVEERIYISIHHLFNKTGFRNNYPHIPINREYGIS